MKRHKNNHSKIIVFIIFLIFLFSILTIKYMYPELTLDDIENIINNKTMDITALLINNLSVSDSDVVIVPDKYDYAYNQLNDKDKKIYEAILLGIVNFKESVVCPSTDINRAYKIYSCVLADYPEFFWVDGAFSLSKQFATRFNLSYLYNRETTEIKQKLIDETVNGFLSGLKPDMTEYDKTLAAYTYIIKNTNYNSDAEDNQNICSVFIGGESVCSGYSKAMQYLLKKMNIQATFISGEIPQRGLHAWNLILLDNEYYYLDSTWGDPIFENPKDNDPEHITYDYFCVTTEELLKTHKPGNDFNLPYCTATKYNYYVYNNILFNSYEFDKIREIIILAGVKGEENISLKFTDNIVLDKAAKELFGDNKIFNILKKIPNDYLNKDFCNYSIDNNKFIINIILKYY